MFRGMQETKPGKISGVERSREEARFIIRLSLFLAARDR